MLDWALSNSDRSTLFGLILLQRIFHSTNFTLILGMDVVNPKVADLLYPCKGYKDIRRGTTNNDALNSHEWYMDKIGDSYPKRVIPSSRVL